MFFLRLDVLFFHLRRQAVLKWKLCRKSNEHFFGTFQYVRVIEGPAFNPVYHYVVYVRTDWYNARPNTCRRDLVPICTDFRFQQKIASVSIGKKSKKNSELTISKAPSPIIVTFYAPILSAERGKKTVGAKTKRWPK